MTILRNNQTLHWRNQEVNKMGKPVKSYKCGAVEAAIFENETAKGVMEKVVLSKRYKSAEGEWKNTNSLDVNDLPKAALALHKAYEFLVMRNNASENPEDPGEDD